MKHKEIEKTLETLVKRVDEQDDLIERLNAKVVMLTLQGTPVNMGVDPAAPNKSGMATMVGTRIHANDLYGSMSAAPKATRIQELRNAMLNAKPGGIIEYDKDDKMDVLSYAAELMKFGGKKPATSRLLGKNVGITITDDITA